MSDLLKAYAEAIESRADTLAYLTAEGKLAAAEVALLELKPYVRKFEVELKRIIKARRSAMPGFLRDAEDAL
jgi:hypothetical protein